MNAIKKYVHIVLLSALVLSIMTTTSCSGSSAGISSPDLVKSVTTYMPDYVGGTDEWVKQQTVRYEYDNAYPVSITTEEESDTSVYTYKYDFNGELPVKMQETSPDGYMSKEIKYTKKGLVNRVLDYDNTGRKIKEQVFQYGNRDNYFTLVLHEGVISTPDEKVQDHMEEIDAVIVETENGFLKKTTNNGLFANYNDEEEKIWRRFDGTYSIDYDANGIASETTAIYKTFPGSGKQYKFEFTIEDGRISEAIRYSFAHGDSVGDSDDSKDEDKWDEEYKYVFEYTDTEISPARYASMINYFLLEGGGNYYIFNWY